MVRIGFVVTFVLVRKKTSTLLGMLAKLYFFVSLTFNFDSASFEMPFLSASPTSAKNPSIEEKTLDGVYKFIRPALRIADLKCALLFPAQ